ncbi:MAG: hypothetical protein ACOYMR_09680 [Ilumatobacteraceae bacterium]
MRTLRAFALIPALGLALVACGSDDAAAPDTTQAPTTVATTGAETTVGATETTADGTGTTEGGPVQSGPVQSGPVQIDVVVGTNSGPDRVEKVAVGSDITLNITNPLAADEFHVHEPIDLEKAAAQNEMVTFNFTVDQPGEIEVESHETEDVYLVIEVG